MNKFITKVAKLVLGLSLAAGVGVAVGSNNKDFVSAHATAGNVTYLHAMSTKPSTGDNTLSTVTWTVSGTNIGSYNSANYAGVQFGTKSASGSITFTSKNAWGEQSTATSYYGKTVVTEVRVWMNAGTGTPTATVTIGGKTATSDGTTVTKNSSASTYEDATCVTYTPASDGNSGVIVISASTSSKAGYFCAIEVDCEEPPVSSLTLDSISVSGSMTKTTYVTDESWDPTGFIVTATYDDNSTATVTLVSWTYSPATPNATNITSVVATASYTEGGVTKTASSSAQAVSVTDKGTSANPYTVSEAWDIANALSSNTNNGKIVYVAGTVIGTPTANNYGATFDITDGSKTLKAYSISGAQISDSSASGYVGDGYTVVVSGAIINHSGTLEVGYASGYNSSLVSSVAPVITTTFDVTFNSNGGSNSPATSEVGDGLTFVFPSPGTKTNYVFKGWSSDNSVFYQEGNTSPTVTADITYTAYWQTEGTSADPYSVAEARAAISANTGIRGVQVSGTISQVGSFDSTTKGITYYISDDGTTTNHLEVYKGKGVGGADFSAASDIKAGATVVVYGNLKLYNATYEFDSGSYQISYTAPAVTYNVTYDANGGSGTMTDSNSPYNSGASVTTLTNTFTRDGYTFANWSTATDGTGDDYAEGESFTISGNTTLYAIWNENSSGSVIAGRCYHLVTDSSDLVDGAKYIIASDSTHHVALSTTQNENNRAKASIAISSSVATVTSDSVQVVTLESTGDNDRPWAFNVGSSYLYAASSSKNYLKTQETNDNNGKWTISIAQSGAATITAQGTNTHNLLKYNSSSSLFSCYASGQSSVYLYRLDFGETLLHNITCSGSGSYTIAEGYSWNDLKSVYQDLPSSEQSSLVSASSDGLTRYDYLIAKYGTGTFENFIDRSITPLSGGAKLLAATIGDNTNKVAIIVVISMVSVTAIGGYFFLKKRREQN